MKLKQRILSLLSALIGMALCGCSTNTDTHSAETILLDTGTKFFQLDERKKEVNVIFFDNDNVVNADGTAYLRPERKISNTLGSSDCYMVKSGDVELLVDCGYQAKTSYGSVNSAYAYNDEYVKKECEENLLKKIASVISPDGVLDYLIVSHADYDHIASLIATGGIFDAFIHQKTIAGLDGSSVKFQKINYLIDFDSGLVKNFSDEALIKEKRLVRSNYYHAYVHQRNTLVEKGTSYAPASALFDNDNLKTQNKEISDENKEAGMPDAIVKRLASVPENSSVQYILDENYAVGNSDKDEAHQNADLETIKDKAYGQEKIFSADVGALKEVKTSENQSRYYYSLKFNDAELRILYNWHYDYIFHASFNRNEGTEDSTQTEDASGNVYDSQDANNISVCCEVVKGNFKFLGLGDLGGNGENGLLKYYAGTDILTNVSVFKSSHHGSVNNGENSENIFAEAKPKIIIVTGCAAYKDPTWKSVDDPVVSALFARTSTKQEFFDNISKAYPDNGAQPMILCTNITAYRSQSGVGLFESVPFYGDIKVKSSGGGLSISTSYCGKIQAYVSRNWNAEYFHNNQTEFSFSTRKGGKILSMQETEWFKAVGLTY